MNQFKSLVALVDPIMFHSVDVLQDRRFVLSVGPEC